ELIRNDDVVLCEQGGDRAGIGGEAALKNDDCLGLLELGQAALELHVKLHRSRDGPDRAGADAETTNRVDCPLSQARVRRQPEVVVGREVDDEPLVETSVSLLF